jgi:hypothetical protein
MIETNFNARYNASNMDSIVQLTLIRSLATLNQVLKELVGIKMPSISKSVFEVGDWHESLNVTVHLPSISSFENAMALFSPSMLVQWILSSTT